VAIRRRSPGRALGTGGTINWRIFKRHFWGELLRHQQHQIEQRAEANLQRRIAINLAADVADDPAKSRPQELELAPGALELMSVDIAADMMAARFARRR
jgi:hypothetical protein